MSHARTGKGGVRGMEDVKDRKARGRTANTVLGETGEDMGPRETRPNVPQEVRAEANRPQSPGAGKHRDDRRDTSRLYTNNTKHKARGNTPRADVKTRKR